MDDIRSGSYRERYRASLETRLRSFNWASTADAQPNRPSRVGMRTSMEYLTVPQARDLPGLRLVLTPGPGPWGQAAKMLMEIRNIPFIPVRQIPFDDNVDLVEWTGTRNAPVAVFNKEAPLESWLDILMLSERVGEGVSLLPPRSVDRAQCIGLAHEICGRDGLGWWRRLSIFANRLALTQGGKVAPVPAHILNAYGAEPQAMAVAAPALR